MSLRDDSIISAKQIPSLFTIHSSVFSIHYFAPTLICHGFAVPPSPLGEGETVLHFDILFIQRELYFLLYITVPPGRGRRGTAYILFYNN